MAGKRSDYDLKIFNISGGLDVPIDVLINDLVWKPSPNMKRDKEIVLMRLHPLDRRDVPCTYTFDQIAEKYNLTRERIRQLVGKMYYLLDRRHRFEFGC